MIILFLVLDLVLFNHILVLAGLQVCCSSDEIARLKKEMAMALILHGISEDETHERIQTSAGCKMHANPYVSHASLYRNCSFGHVGPPEETKTNKTFRASCFPYFQLLRALRCRAL